MRTATVHTHAISRSSVQPIAGVYAATLHDAPRLTAVLTRAFASDPPVRWVYPDDEQYRCHFPDFVLAFGGGALSLGTAHCTDGFTACALWLPPNEEPDDAALIELIERSVPRRRHAEVFALLEAMGDVHPAQPHWYLPLIGVDPAFQNRRTGSAVLQRTLGDCGREGLPAYLEATSPRNIRLYERHGFRRLPPLRVGSCPPITPMWRELL